MQKVFRVFVSSTFSDFKDEREILQTEIFPEIKKYCVDKGALFQPIDLRWGVSEEAQLDQKTLEVCLDEVKHCKDHPKPNFILLTGDRYGWIPLPFMIEKDEFEILLSKVKDEKLLKEWYRLDENQIPASYRLQERKGKYVKYEEWEKVENTLREILQEASKVLKKESQIAKYFTSATEAEFLERISKDENVKDNIFAFIRNIKDKGNTDNNFYEANNHERAAKLKEKIREQVSNLLELDAKIVGKNELDYEKDRFKECLKKFLKEKIDEFFKSENKSDQGNDDKEKKEDGNLFLKFKTNKLEDFISTPELDKVTKELLDYIDDTNSNKPYFISGRSGSGKSALMAHIIDEAEKNLKKISYIFIGTTPRSTNLNYVLSYLLGDNMPYVETEDGNITIKNAKISLSSQDDEGISSKEDIFSYKDMCKKAVETINALGQKEENFVFMIDAIDQLNTNNNPEWIPEILPSNVKLIISMLNDNNYSDDSSAYNFIKDRNYKVIELKKYSKALDLLENTLKKKNRKVTQEQSNYFLEQYKDAQTPFFIKMAAMEMAEWKSYDVIKKDVDLANNNKDVVKEFISNLGSIHHHSKDFIQKILCYLYISQNGLSENEILELLDCIVKNNNKRNNKFIEAVSPEKWHKNPIQNFPTVHWSRLWYVLKDLLKRSVIDGREVLYFFHREFENAIYEIYENELKKETENFLEDIVVLFDTSKGRWQVLFLSILEFYVNRYNENVDKYCQILANKNDIDDTLRKRNKKLTYLSHNNPSKDLISRFKILSYIVEILYKQDSKKWARSKAVITNNLATIYFKFNKEDKVKDIKELLKNSLAAIDSGSDKEQWAITYKRIFTNLLFAYLYIGDSKELKDLLSKFRGYKQINSGDIIFGKEPYTLLDITPDQLNDSAIDIFLNLPTENIDENLANILYDICVKITNNNKNINPKQYIMVLEKASSIIKPLYEKSPDSYSNHYAYILNKLAVSYYELKDINSAINRLFELPQEDMSDELVNIPYNNIISFTHEFTNVSNINIALALLIKAKDIIEPLYNKDNKKWANNWAEILNLAAKNYFIKQDCDNTLNMLINLPTDGLNDETANTCIANITQLHNIIKAPNLIDQIKAQKDLLEKAREITKNKYKENPQKWASDHVKILNPLVVRYKDLNDITNMLSALQDIPEQYLSIEAIDMSFKNIVIIAKALKRSGNQEISKELLNKAKVILEPEFNYWNNMYMEVLNELKD